MKKPFSFKHGSKEKAGTLKVILSILCGAVLAGILILSDASLPQAHTMESVLVCGKQEHSHSDACWSLQKICSELEHQHDSACYDETGALVCTLPEHIHGDQCFQRRLNCGFAEEHLHNEQCYRQVSVAAGDEQGNTPEEKDPSMKEARTEGTQAEPEKEKAEDPSENGSEENTEVPTQTPEEKVPEEEAPNGKEEQETTGTELLLKWTCDGPKTLKLHEKAQWTFLCENADQISFSIQDQKEQAVASGDLTGRAVLEWSTGTPGTYLLTVEAVQGETRQTIQMTVKVEAEALTASVRSEQRSVFAQEETLVFHTALSGAGADTAVEYRIYANGNCVFTQEGYTAEIRFAPTSFGIHTLQMTAVGSDGQKTEASCSVPVAVRETEQRSEWEKGLRQVELTGNFADDLVKIAATQVGYAESERNFIINEEGKTYGYTRYGDWYGTPYSDWCAIFVDFCAHYAQIPASALPREAGCATWKETLGNLYIDAQSDYVPQSGDLIFFYRDGGTDQTTPVHVGIVTQCVGDSIATIEGNSAGQVRRRNYARTDAPIAGYVSMKEVQRLADPDAEWEEPQEGASETEQPEGTYAVINKNKVNLRALPTTQSDILLQVGAGKEYLCRSCVRGEDGNLWYRVVFKERDAYVMADYADLVTRDPSVFEPMVPAENLREGLEMLENGVYRLVLDEDTGETCLLVYGRYGDGQPMFYLCDENGIPLGKDAGFGETVLLKTIAMNVTVEADQKAYLDKDNNTVSLTIVLQAQDNGAMLKNSPLTLTINDNDAVSDLVADSISTTGGAFTNLKSSQNQITATVSNDVKQNTVTVKCHYTISGSASYGQRTITVTANAEKEVSGSGSTSYTYSKAEGVCVSSVTAPKETVAPGDTVNGSVHLQNYDADAYTVTKLVVKDAAGNVICTQEDLSVSVAGNGTGSIPFTFSAPTGKFVSAGYTVEVTYGDGKTNTGSFTITLPDEPQLKIKKNVSVTYDDDDNASFGAMNVTATDYAVGTDNNRNKDNAAELQFRGADGKWKQIASVSGNIEDGAILFDLLKNGSVTPDMVLNRLFRMQLTQANKKSVSAESEWFYLTDSLPKSGFREWTLDPANGYLDADGKFIGNMDTLAEAYKKYSRLGLTVTSENVTGEAGQTAVLPVRVSSDEAMTGSGVIELALSDGTADGALSFTGCTGQSDLGSVRINSRGNIEWTLSRTVAAGSDALVNVTVPLGYDAALGAHPVAIDAKYRSSSSGAVQKQAQGTGEITVTPATGWHILSVASPSGAAMPGGNVNFTLILRNFDAQEKTLNTIRAALADANLEIVGIRQLSGGVTTEIPLDQVSVTLPAATGEGDDYQPGNAVLQLRVKAPNTAMSNEKAAFALADADGHEETAQGLLSVVEPTLTLRPVVDYDPASGTVTVKLAAENAGSPQGAYTWQDLDTRDAYADWKTIATTGTSSEWTLTDKALEELQAFGAESARLQYRVTDASGNTVYAMSNAAAFENLPQLMKAVEVVAKLAEHYGYSYASFRDLIDHLYYVEVAKDGGVPFSDANSLMLYLQSCYESGGIDSAVKAWEKYRYDLYDPHEWPSLQRKADQGSINPYPGRENVDPQYDFGDNRLGYEKDETGTPFHVNPASKVNPVGGQDEDYFGGLEKTAGAVENGDANTRRQYTIDLTAQAKNKVLVPAAMVFQIQTSWQMFDLEHANGVNGPKGSPCTVENMATLYDIKHALIDFAEWLRENGDGSVVFAITDVEHAGTFNALSSPYFTNDADTLIAALEGWDVFGNCEHVHYSQNAYSAAVTALGIKSNFQNWIYTPDGQNLYDYARKITVVIGGSTENSSGTDGYGCVIAAGDSMQYVYTIRTNSGTGTLSWLDNAGMTALTDARGFAYKNVDTRQKVFDTLVDIVKQFQMTEAARCVNDVTISDVIADEFEYVQGSARVVRMVNGQEEETPVTPKLTTETDERGKTVTRLTYTFPDSETTRPGEKLHLRFDVAAKENYIGSNNVYTNVGKATLSYTDSIMGKKSVRLDFPETPQVNVPIRYNIQDGGETTVGVGAEVDLWSLGETIVREMNGDTDGIEDWSVRYDQINGSVTYQWLKNVGTEEEPIYEPVSAESKPVHVTNGVPDGDGFQALEHVFSSEETGDFPFVLKTTFTPDAKSDSWSGVNDGAVDPLTKYGKVVVHVVKATNIQVLKLDAQTDQPLAGAAFILSKDGKTLTFAKQADGSYTPGNGGSVELVTGEDGRLPIAGLLNGSYVLSEKSAPDGYATDKGSEAFTTKNGAITEHTENGEHWSCDIDALTITLKNEVKTKPVLPYPDPPEAGNETSMTVRKIWSGDEDDTLRRPQKITVQLQMNGVDCGDPVELSADTNWTYTWDKLPYKDENGEEIEYSAYEDETGAGMQWYDARNGEVETIPGEPAGVYWVKQGLSEQGGTYAIYSNGYILQSASDPSKNSATGASLRTNQSHNGIAYDSELTAAPGAAAQWTITKTADGCYQIQNGGYYLTTTQDGKLTYSKTAGNAVWNLNGGKLSVTYVKKDGKSETKWLKLEGNKDDSKLSLDEQKKATSFTFYSPITVAGTNDRYVRSITNVYKDPNAKTKLVVQKVWANNGAYLHANDTVTMQVYRNGEPLQTLSLNAAGGWSAELNDLPLYEVVDEAAGRIEKYVYSVYEEPIPNDTASGEGEAAFVVTDETTGEGYYEAVITNTRVKGEYTPTKPATSANKRIDYLGDEGANDDTSLKGEDDYRLYLDFTGASEPIDVLFVIDTTGSMTGAMGSGDKTPRQTVVSNLMNGTNGQMGYLDRVATMNPANNVAVMLFSGPEYGSTANGRPYEANKADCQYILLDWTSGGKALGTQNYTNRKSGTYYDPAFMRAREMFSSPKVAGNGHRKVLIFMTDGEPNGYIDDQLTYQYSSDSTVRNAHILQAVQDFEAEFPNVTRYTVGISSDVDGVKGLLGNMAGSSARFFSAKSTSEMTAALEAILSDLTPRDVVMTDELSPYVELNTANTDLKITRTNRSTKEEETIWTGSSVSADGSIGSAASGYADILQSVQYTAAKTADSTGTITATFKPEYRVDSQYTYALSYNVKLTNTAYRTLDENAEYPHTGDADTDRAGNITSSEKAGFHSNASAKVDYTASGKKWSDLYPHPVIQLAEKSVTAEAPEITKTVNLNGAAPESGTFAFAIEALEPENAPLPEQTTAEWTYDESTGTSGTVKVGEISFNRAGTYLYRITETAGQDPNWSYDASEYRWTVTVTRNEDNSLTAESTLTKKGAEDEAGTTAERVEFVNEYACDLPWKLVKSDSTNHEIRLSGATFALYSDAACTSLVPVYADEDKTLQITEFTTAGENGEITVYGLKPGAYYLKELAAPAGYCVISGALPILIGPDGTVTLPEASVRIETDPNESGTVIVYDSPVYEIPSTGGRGTQGFYLVGLALMLLAVRLQYMRRKRAKEVSQRPFCK